MRHRLYCIAIALCLLVNAAVGLTVTANNATVTGTVHVSDRLRVRDIAGTVNSTVIGYLYNNDVVTILDTVTLDNGDRWHHITKGAVTGYASAEYISINPSYQTDEQFEAYLTAQGFPEDYKAGLRDIHAQYPNWIFEARHLTMSWSTAFSAELRIGLNTIKNPDAWKSMEYGAYDWNSGNYVSYDTGGWVTASPRLVAYQMDPRNFLNASDVFQFEKLTFSAAHTADGIRAILPDELDGYADTLLQAAQDTNTSAYFLAARIAKEGSHVNGLGTGTVDGYEGYYNFFHINTYAANGNSAVVNGAIYAQSQGWNSPYKCIQDSANRIAREYIRLGQDTMYFQKFNVTNTQSGLYRHQYMSNVTAAVDEGRIRLKSATDSELQNALVFSIPVYQEMPGSIAPEPSQNGNNNNFLNSLSVDGAELTPSFDRYTTGYSLYVESADYITIHAAKSDENATVTGDGGVAIQPGVNTIPITVQATSGETRTYTLTVTCDGPNGERPVITGTTHVVGETVTKVEPNTTVATFVQNLAVTGGTASVYTADGQAKATDGIVATGDILRLHNGPIERASYPIVIYGDVNGDGAITALDLRVAQKHILGTAPLNGYNLTAADSGKDGTLSALDLRITQKFILGITTTLQ